MDSFMLKIRLLFFGWFILDGRMKLHHLVEALFWGLMAPEILWKGLPQAVYGGEKTPADNAGQGWCPGSPAGLSNSASAPGPVPFRLQCTWILPMFLLWDRGWSLREQRCQAQGWE